ncbi:MAG: hypothetical protein ACM335_02560 [Deltaproteobacteria bacterium]
MSSSQPLHDKNWRRAQQRVLAYLHFLNLSSVETLELALQALNQARSRVEDSPESHPITESWRALQAILAERASPAGHDFVSPEGRLPPLTGLRRLCGPIQSMPAVNRGSMVPGKLR